MAVLETQGERRQATPAPSREQVHGKVHRFKRAVLTGTMAAFVGIGGLVAHHAVGAGARASNPGASQSAPAADFGGGSQSSGGFFGDGSGGGALGPGGSGGPGPSLGSGGS